jgi:hypothetical protein
LARQNASSRILYFITLIRRTHENVSCWPDWTCTYVHTWKLTKPSCSCLNFYVEPNNFRFCPLSYVKKLRVGECQ